MNKREIIDQIRDVSELLQDIKNELEDFNTEEEQFDYVTSPALADATDKMYNLVHDIDKIVYQGK